MIYLRKAYRPDREGHPQRFPNRQSLQRRPSARPSAFGPTNVNLEFVVDHAPSYLDADDDRNNNVAKALVQN